MQSKVWLTLLPCNHFPFFSATGAHNGRQSLDLHIPIFAAEGAAAFHLQSILLKSIEAALRSAHPSDQTLTQRFRGCTSRQPLCYHLDIRPFTPDATPIYFALGLSADTVYSALCVYCVYIICIHVSPSLGIIGTAWITHTHTLGQHRWPSHWPELSLTTDLLPVSASSTSRGNNTPLLCSRCCLQTAQSGNTVGSCQYGHARNGMFQGTPSDCLVAAQS